MSKRRYAVIVSVILQGQTEIQETIFGVHGAAYPALKQREHIVKRSREAGFVSTPIFPFAEQVKRANHDYYLHNTASGAYLAVSVCPEFDNLGQRLWNEPDWVANGQ